MKRPSITTLIGCLILLHQVVDTVAFSQQRPVPPNSVPMAVPVQTIGRAEIYYSRQFNQNSVFVMHLPIWEKHDNRIDLTMRYTTVGLIPHLPEKIEIDFSLFSNKSRVQGSSTIEFIVDGKRWEPISVETQVDEDAGMFLEEYVFLLGVEQFRQIGQARSVIVKLGGMKVSIKAGGRKAFLDMLRTAK